MTAERKVADLGLRVLPAAEFIKQATRVCIHAIQTFATTLPPSLPLKREVGAWRVQHQATKLPGADARVAHNAQNLSDGEESSDSSSSDESDSWGLASGKGRASFRDANIRFLPSFLVDAAAASIRAAPSPWRRPPRRNRHSGLAKMLPTSAKSPVAGRVGAGDEA